MGNELVKIRRDDDVLRVTLNRPPLNFLNTELLRAFEAGFESDGPPRGCRALILDSEGTAFCAGLEVREQTREGIFLLLESYHKAASIICSFPAPTIALVRGMVLGAGNELAACCDVVIASASASFGQPEIKMGTLPSLAPLLLPQLVGHRRAQELILTGKMVGAKDAQAMGLVNRVVPDDQLAAAPADLVRNFRELSLPVLELGVESTRRARLGDLNTRLREAQSLYLNQLAELDDRIEGIRAFVEKRAPRWRN